MSIYQRKSDRPQLPATDSSVIKAITHTGDEVHIPKGWLEERLQIEMDKDATLKVPRDNYPVNLFFFPPSDSPLPTIFCNIADWISSVSSIDFQPDNTEQGAMLRCIQFYFDARALWLTNEICNRYVADLPTLAIQPNIPKQDFNNLSLAIPAEVARYRLLRAGEADIKQWCQREGIDYPFHDALALFVTTLREDFISLLESCLQPTPVNPPSKVKRRQAHRDWTQFFSGVFEEATPEYTEFITGLRARGWLGLSLLALLEKRTAPHLKKAWKTFIQTHRKLIPLIDQELIWKQGFPHQAGRTSRTDPITCKISKHGYFSWHRKS